MDDVQAFFHMGGYAAYVWSAYALTFIVLFLNLLSAKNAHRKVLSDVARRQGGASHSVSMSADAATKPGSDSTPRSTLQTDSDVSKASQTRVGQ